MPALMTDTSMLHLKVPRMTPCACNPSLGQSEGCKEQFLQLLGKSWEKNAKLLQTLPVPAGKSTGELQAWACRASCVPVVFIGNTSMRPCTQQDFKEF